MQTVSVPAPRATHRALALIIAAAVLTLVVVLSVLRFTASNTTPSGHTSIARLAPVTQLFESCRAGRPC